MITLQTHRVCEVPALVARDWYRAQGLTNVDPTGIMGKCYGIRDHEDGHYAGMAVVVRATYNPYVERRVDTLSSVYVIPERRGRGYGRLLVEEIMKLYPRLVLTVLQDNTAAHRLYESVGFTTHANPQAGRWVMETAATQLDLLKQQQPGQGFGYIEASLKMDQALRLHQILTEMGFKKLIPAEDMHATLMYDTGNPVKYDGSRGIHFRASVDGYKHLGSGKWEAITLLLRAPRMLTYHEDLKRYGFEHSYPDFTPHLSLKYRPTAEDRLRLAKVPDRLRGMELMFVEQPWKYNKG